MLKDSEGDEKPILTHQINLRNLVRDGASKRISIHFRSNLRRNCCAASYVLKSLVYFGQIPLELQFLYQCIFCLQKTKVTKTHIDEDGGDAGTSDLGDKQLSRYIQLIVGLPNFFGYIRLGLISETVLMIITGAMEVQKRWCNPRDH